MFESIKRIEEFSRTRCDYFNLLGFFRKSRLENILEFSLSSYCLLEFFSIYICCGSKRIFAQDDLCNFEEEFKSNPFELSVCVCNI